jgi:hypothetical protein
MPFGLAEIGIVPRGKKDWTATLAEGNRRQEKAVVRISSACLTPGRNQSWHCPAPVEKDERKTFLK